jgi:regulator of protease activity HflC (stomatin/prohibitin superfamily)
MFDKLIDLIITFAKLFQFWRVLSPYQAGVRIRLGKYHSTLGPGWHWFAPFNIDSLIEDSVVTETIEIRPQSLTTKDGKQIVLSSVVTCHIEDVKTFLLDVEGRNAALKDATCGVISDFIMKRTWAELNDIQDIGNELAKAVRRKAKMYGVNVHTVQLADFTITRSFRLIDWK